MTDVITEELREALVSIEGVPVPDDLRKTAFACAFWGAREGRVPPQGSDKPAGPSERDDDHTPQSGGTLADRIASKLDLTIEELEFIYEFEGDDLSLRIPPSRLNSVKKDAVKQIVYLVASGRQAGSLEDKTSARLLKEVCVERGKADTNFSRILDSLHGEGVAVGGSGRLKTVRVNADGFERTAELIRELKEG